MPVLKCPNGKYKIGSGPCVFGSKAKAERAYAAYRAQKHDSDEEPDEFNIMFVDSMDGVKYKILEYGDSHPEWNFEQLEGAANAYYGLQLLEDRIKNTNLSGVIERVRNISLSRFATLIKSIKTRSNLKVGAMGLLAQRPELPMKNLNRLQTKLEKLVTAEAKNLTAEQYEQRKQYAKYMRKADSDIPELDDDEYTEELENLYDAIIEYYPECEPDEAMDKAFQPPLGDRAWILSNEAEIISINDGMNNILKAPIILAVEGVQPYPQEDGTVEYHFKPYSELKLAVERAQKNGPLDMIIEHQDWYDAENVMGVVKNIRADDNKKGIRGTGYFTESKLPEGLRNMIRDKKTVPVSIGFLARLGEGGTYNGQYYKYTQRDIILRHLAICLDSVPRCPAGVCGVNLEDSETSKVSVFTIINKDNYYYNICKMFNDSKNETNKNISITNFENSKIMQTDADKEGHIAGDEPEDLDAILSRLRKFMSGTIEKEYAAGRILAALGLKTKGDSEMDEKEFQDALKLKESENEELKLKLEDALGKIKQFEEKEKLNYINVIKKFGNKYSDEELQSKTLASLEEIADAVSRFSPSYEKPDVLPVTPKPSRKTMEDDIKKGERIDFSKIWDEKNKEFDMSGL